MDWLNLGLGIAIAVAALLALARSTSSSAQTPVLTPPAAATAAAAGAAADEARRDELRVLREDIGRLERAVHSVHPECILPEPRGLSAYERDQANRNILEQLPEAAELRRRKTAARHLVLHAQLFDRLALPADRKSSVLAALQTDDAEAVKALLTKDEQAVFRAYSESVFVDFEDVQARLAANGLPALTDEQRWAVRDAIAIESDRKGPVVEDLSARVERRVAQLISSEQLQVLKQIDRDRTDLAAMEEAARRAAQETK